MLAVLRALPAFRSLTCASQLPQQVLLRAFSAAQPQPSTHYEVLGLQNSATAEEIKSAFRKVKKKQRMSLHRCCI
jgi:DnaJ-domain-containing protein 1